MGDQEARGAAVGQARSRAAASRLSDNELASVPAAAPSHRSQRAGSERRGRDALLPCRGAALLARPGRSREALCSPHWTPAGLPRAGPTREPPHPRFIPDTRRISASLDQAGPPLLLPSPSLPWFNARMKELGQRNGTGSKLLLPGVAQTLDAPGNLSQSPGSGLWSFG